MAFLNGEYVRIYIYIYKAAAMAYMHLFNDTVSVVELFLSSCMIVKLSSMAGRYRLVRKLSFI